MTTVANLNSIEEIKVTDSRNSMQKVVESHSQFVMTFEQNTSYIGKGQTVEIVITLTNNGTYPLTNVRVTTETTGSYIDVEDLNQNLGVLSPHENISTALKVSIPSTIDNDVDINVPVDMVLAIDGSGSMGDEIGAVQSKLLDLVTNLTATIPDIRFGGVIFGSSIHSQFPTDSTSNYQELTADQDAIITFLQGLSAGGGIEPWGDALYLADSWDWRENPVGKILILIGDEDCDPGRVIGAGSVEDYYNGSQLVEVVHSLASKDVKINTVICSGADSITENQFKWIAKVSGGTSIYLGDTWFAEENVFETEELPELIKEWTINASHEDVGLVKIKANAENELGEVLEAFAETFFWVDLTPPTATVNHQSMVLDENIILTLVIQPEDVSGIESVVLYYQIGGKPREFKPLKAPYIYSFPPLLSGTEIEYYFVILDSCGNRYESPITLVTVEIPILEDGAKLKLFLAENLTATYRLQNTGQESYIIANANSTSLHVQVFETESTIYDEMTDFLALPILSNNDNEKFVQFESKAGTVECTIYYSILQSFNQDEVRIVTFDLTNQVALFKCDIGINNESEEYYPWISYPDDSAVIGKMRVFNTSWDEIGIVTPSETFPINISGTYYFLVYREYREGELNVSLETELPDEADGWRGYYPAAPTNSWALIPALLILGLGAGWGVVVRKKRRRSSNSTLNRPNSKEILAGIKREEIS